MDISRQNTKASHWRANVKYCLERNAYLLLLVAIATGEVHCNLDSARGEIGFLYEGRTSGF